jgi:hypothetical protein
MASNGASTRLFRAIVGLGLSASAAACGGLRDDRAADAAPDVVREAADQPSATDSGGDGAQAADAADEVIIGFGNPDAGVAPDAPSGDAPSDVVSEQWYPVPIA